MAHTLLHKHQSFIARTVVAFGHRDEGFSSVAQLLNRRPPLSRQNTTWGSKSQSFILVFQESLASAVTETSALIHDES